MNRIIGLTLLLVIEGACPLMAGAAESENTGTLRFALENDMFQGSDGHYTNGVRVSWHSVKPLSANKFAGDLSRHGQQWQVFWSSFLGTGLDPVGSMRQLQGGDARKYGRNYGAYLVLMRSA